MRNPSPVFLFSCGGTMDKIYYDAANDYRIGEPTATGILKRARSDYPPPVSLMKKDSLDMTEDDRVLVAAAVRDCKAPRIVVTHGTDTMAETARVVAATVGDKTVVFVGAWLPTAFKDSDADFNLGFALAAATAMPVGVYLAMNGRILPAAVARKNRAAGHFEAV